MSTATYLFDETYLNDVCNWPSKIDDKFIEWGILKGSDFFSKQAKKIYSICTFSR